MDGDLDEYLSSFPYEKEFAEKCLNEYKHIKMLMTDHDKTDYKSQFPERKDFAMFVKSQTESGIVNVPLSTFKTLLFNAYDHKCVSWFNNLSAASYIRLFIGE
jgi:hypothetical protein